MSLDFSTAQVKYNSIDINNVFLPQRYI